MSATLHVSKTRKPVGLSSAVIWDMYYAFGNHLFTCIMPMKCYIENIKYLFFQTYDELIIPCLAVIFDFFTNA